MFSPDPLPLDLLALVNAEIGLAAQQVRLPDGLQLSDLDMTLVVQDGNLRIKPLTAGLYDGRVEADVAMTGASQALKTTLNATAVNYGRLLRDLQINDQVEGSADVVLFLEGQGASLRDIASTASGRWEWSAAPARSTMACSSSSPPAWATSSVRCWARRSSPTCAAWCSTST